MTENRKLAANSLWNFGAYVFYTGASFLSARLYIDQLGLKEYGLLVLTGSLIAPLGLLNFGFAQATVKYMAEAFGQRDLVLACRYLGNTLLFNVVIGLAGAMLLIIAAPFLATHLFSIEAPLQAQMGSMLRWTGGTWLATQVSATFGAVPMAQQRYSVVSLGTTFFSTASLLIGLGVLFMGGSLVAVVQARFVWSVLTIAGWWVVAKRSCPELRISPRYDVTAFRQSFRFGAWQTAATAGGIAANQADKYLLGIYISADAVGAYNVPVLIFTTIYTAVSKCADILFPAMSQLHGRDDKAGLLGLLQRSGWTITSLMVTAQAVLFVFAPDILQLYLGAVPPAGAVQVLRISAIMAVISAPSVVMSQYLLGVGETRLLAVMALASGVINVAGGMMLVPRYGLSGAAWSDVVAIVGTRPILHYLIWRKCFSTQIPARRLLGALYGAGIVGTPLVIALGWGRSLFVGSLGWGGLAGFSICVGAFVYWVTQFCGGPFFFESGVVELKSGIRRWFLSKINRYLRAR